MNDTFDPSAVDYTGIEPGADIEFRQFKPGVFEFEIKDIVWETDEKGRGLIRFRFDLVDGQNPQMITKEGDELLKPDALKAGSVFERFYFHTPKAIPMFAKFLEKQGLPWTDYVASSDKKAFVGTLAGRRFKAVVEYNEEYKKNEIGRYLA